MRQRLHCHSYSTLLNHVWKACISLRVKRFCCRSHTSDLFDLNWLLNLKTWLNSLCQSIWQRPYTYLTSLIFIFPAVPVCYYCFITAAPWTFRGLPASVKPCVAGVRVAIPLPYDAAALAPTTMPPLAEARLAPILVFTLGTCMPAMGCKFGRKFAFFGKVSAR